MNVVIPKESHSNLIDRATTGSDNNDNNTLPKNMQRHLRQCHFRSAPPPLPPQTVCPNKNSHFFCLIFFTFSTNHIFAFRSPLLLPQCAHQSHGNQRWAAFSLIFVGANNNQAALSFHSSERPATPQCGHHAAGLAVLQYLLFIIKFFFLGASTTEQRRGLAQLRLQNDRARLTIVH